MRKGFFLFLWVAASVIPVAHADVLAIPEADPAAAATTPARGATQAAVLKHYGQPIEQYAPVGGSSPQHPPITRWDYDGFSVFFERNIVIDVVIKGQPQPIRNVDELKAQP